MELFTLLKREIKEPIRPILIFVILSGIVNALLIAIINTATESVSDSGVNGKLFLLFGLGTATFLLAKKYVLDKSVFIVETTMYRLQLRMANKIRHTELDTLEGIGTSSLYARITQDTVYISNVSSTLISATQSAIMISFTILYIGAISLLSFFLVVIAISIGVVAYIGFSKSFRYLWERISIKETGFFEKLGHILKGFKEIKINRSKNEDVFNNYKIVNNDLKNFRIKVSARYNILLIFSQVFFYILLGSILFILPFFHSEHSEDVIKVTAAILFIIGPFEGVVTSMQLFDKANNATRNIMALEALLEKKLNENRLSIEAQNKPAAYQSLPYFDNIQFKNLRYTYPPTKENERLFTVGPVNLTFRKGELIFITGGNGSGKSTFLKLLTGLYAPKEGEIIVDAGIDEKKEEVVTVSNYQQYRNLFTTIFTDFHLFDKLYGLEKVNSRIVNKLLENMELPKEKTVYEDGGFSNLRLSSGQKKRLALATSIIEDKSIYIFDEVAADLDPEFRDKYYYELLTELKERNKTVIVVSHDRHYWTVPDRLLEMENGSIRELSKADIKSLLALNRD